MQKGLNLDLYVGKPDTYHSSTDSRSATVYVYNHSSFYVDTDATLASGGFATNIILSKQISEMYVKPYSSCEIKNNVKLALPSGADTQIVDLFLASSYKYTSSNCYDYCYHIAMIEKCNCIDDGVPYLNLKNAKLPRICVWNSEDGADYACWLQVVDTYEDTCNKKCPFECDLVTMSATTSMAAYLATDSQYLSVSIYYKSLSYEYSTENPAITEVALFSSLGGTLGK